MELWKVPPDPVLEAVAQLVSVEIPEWIGSLSELLERLPELELPANVLTRRLNVGAERLFNDYGIQYESSRNHNGRTVRLLLV